MRQNHLKMDRKLLLGSIIILFYSICPLFAQQAKLLQFREETYNFGNIEENKGPVTHEFVFTNNGPRPVTILSVQASCGCTTPNWSKEPVQPGKTGFIQARFDPKGRPGYFNKSLTVVTDADPNPIVLQIKGQVVTGEVVERDFRVSRGALKFKVSSFNMGKVFRKDEFTVREFPVLNGGSAPVAFTGQPVSPSYIRVEVEPKILPPGGVGIIRIGYNGKAKNQYGFQSDNIELPTDDPTDPVKSISVYATLEDYFPEMPPEELAKAPQLRLQEITVDLGKLSTKTPVTREVSVINTGKSDLVIRAVQTNCTCVTAAVDQTTLKPGERTILKVVFDPAGRKGLQQKAVTLYSNDPQNPVQRFSFTAYVEG